jgi:methyl-accepting chemotaxis protein
MSAPNGAAGVTDLVLKLLPVAPLLVAIGKAWLAVDKGKNEIEDCTFQGGRLTDVHVVKYLAECSSMAASGASGALSEMERLFTGRINRIVSPINIQIGNVVLWGLFATIIGLTLSLFSLSSVLERGASGGISEAMQPVLGGFGYAFIGSGLGVACSIVLQFKVRTQLHSTASIALEGLMDEVRRAYVGTTEQALLKSADESANELKKALDTLVAGFKDELRNGVASLADYSQGLNSTLASLNEAALMKFDESITEASGRLGGGADQLSESLRRIDLASSQLASSLERESDHSVRIEEAIGKMSEIVAQLSTSTSSVESALQSTAVRKFSDAVAGMSKSLQNLDESTATLANKADSAATSTYELRAQIASGVMHRDETLAEVKQHIQELTHVLSSVKAALQEADQKREQAARESKDAEQSLARLASFAESLVSSKAQIDAVHEQQKQLIPSLSAALSEMRSSVNGLSQAASELAGRAQSLDTRFASSSFGRYETPNPAAGALPVKQPFWVKIWSKIRRKD